MNTFPRSVKLCSPDNASGEGIVALSGVLNDETVVTSIVTGDQIARYTWLHQAK